VARLAGLPGNVIDRAQAVLELLNTGEHSGAVTKLADYLPLFQSAPAPKPKQESKVEKQLKDIDPDSLTAREALEALYALKQSLTDNG
jgi:DNA mismatch repair protein MutS